MLIYSPDDVDRIVRANHEMDTRYLLIKYALAMVLGAAVGALIRSMI